MTIPTRQLLPWLALVDYPALQIGGRAVEGREAWAELLSVFPPLAPSERATILRQIGEGPGLDLGHGKAKRRAWEEHPTDPGDLAEPPLYGDEAAFPPALYAWNLVPLMARAYAVVHAAILLVGASLTGFIIPPLAPGKSVIVVDGLAARDVVVWTLLHELAHLWTIAKPSCVANTNLAVKRFAASMIDPTKAAARYRRDEEIANLLSACWLCAEATCPRVLDGPRVGGWVGSR